MPVKLPWDSSTHAAKASGRYIREKSDELYHTARWNRLSHAFRDRHPLCENCRRQGFSVAATCTDHIIPMPLCRDFFFEESNLQSLCDRCNNLKGQRDKQLIDRWTHLSDEQKVIETLRQVRKIYV